MRAKFICFIGIDGSGKTTLIKNVLDRHKCRYIRCRFEGFKFFYLPYLFLIMILKKTGKKTDYSSDGVMYKNTIFSKGYIRKLYTTAVLIDYIIQILLKVPFHLYLSRKAVLCDRYVYDTVIDLASEFKRDAEWSVNFIKLLLYFMPTPDYIVILDVDPQTAFIRSLAKGEKTPLSYLENRRELYYKISNCLKNAVLVDTRNDFNGISENIRRLF